jgi:hypothetical protein
MAKQKRVEKEYTPQFSHALLHTHHLRCYYHGSKRIAEMPGEKGFDFLGWMPRIKKNRS